MAFNQLTPAAAERLDILQEECAEVIKAVAKIKRHGFESYNPDNPSVPRISNRMELARELGDVIGVMDAMCTENDISGPAIERHGKEAWAKKLRYTHHQTTAVEQLAAEESRARSALWTRQIRTWSDDELAGELAHYAGKLAAVTSWGAAVGEYQKNVRLIQAEMDRRLAEAATLSAFSKVDPAPQ